ncbi:MAG: hypothetical protein AAGU10_08435 [Methanosarcina mazei]|uniref:Uncharacterized protein n=1 Tax=Methanosarcina mazei TaxID=2209 RepID=A0A0F8RJQ9_METMZ|nr:hypothetical protein [Methanosarcina mazei]KKH61209.1 hypothetical protein DU74_07380 [Methanosarcina mazei]
MSLSIISERERFSALLRSSELPQESLQRNLLHAIQKSLSLLAFPDWGPIPSADSHRLLIVKNVTGNRPDILRN